MEAVVSNLEKVVQKADDRLGTIAWKLDEFQKGTLQCPDDIESEVSVVELMQGVCQIRQDYENLHGEIRKVQTLQKELTNSLKIQIDQVRGKFTALQEKLSQTRPI